MKEGKIFLLGLFLALVLLIVGIYMFINQEKEEKTPATPPALIETPAPTRFVFEEELKEDTTITFNLKPGDTLKAVSYKNENNMVVIYETKMGDKFQIICYQKQDWNPLPKDDELIFSNGKVLSVKFITSKLLIQEFK